MQPPDRPTPEAIASQLTAKLRGEVYTDVVTRGIYSTDASHYQQQPQIVVVPMDEADVVAALRIANKHKIPVTPRGAATALSGQTFGPGMVLDLSKHFTEVLEVNAEEGWARVQPGVVRDQLNAQLSPLGLHFTPDPATSSRATIGGMVGNNSSGTRSMVYGKNDRPHSLLQNRTARRDRDRLRANRRRDLATPSRRPGCKKPA